MPEDLLFREDFANKTKMAISGLKEHISSNEYLILGAPKYSKDVSDIRNSVFILNNREIK